MFYRSMPHQLEPFHFFEVESTGLSLTLFTLMLAALSLSSLLVGRVTWMVSQWKMSVHNLQLLALEDHALDIWQTGEARGQYRLGSSKKSP
jgi:hypothetical protein